MVVLGALSQLGASRTLLPRPHAVKGAGARLCPGSCPLITAPQDDVSGFFCYPLDPL